MSGAAQGSNQTAKLQSKDAAAGGQPSKETQKPVAALEEDDEFEDFPVEGWYPVSAIPCVHESQ